MDLGLLHLMYSTCVRNDAFLSAFHLKVNIYLDPGKFLHGFMLQTDNAVALHGQPLVSLLQQKSEKESYGLECQQVQFCICSCGSQPTHSTYTVSDLRCFLGPTGSSKHQWSMQQHVIAFGSNGFHKLPRAYWTYSRSICNSDVIVFITKYIQMMIYIF